MPSSTSIKTSKSKSANGVQDIQNLKSEVEYRTKLQEISNSIYAALNLDEILIDLKDDIVELVNAERITIYYVDGVRRELVSRFKSGNEVSEIRVPISNTSIAGYAAAHQKLINVKNVYDASELAKIDDELKFNKSWDKKTGFRTQQVLVVPIVFKSFVLGAIQLINRKSGGPFIKNDEENVTELANIMGIALYKQKKMATSRKSKFDYLLQNHILTQKELNRAIASSRDKKIPIVNVLIDDLKISQKDIVEALSRYYDMPLIQFNENLPIPGELLRGLKVGFMKNNVWVPIRTEKDEIVIAIDNPEDIQRVDEVRSLFSGRKIKLAYALKDDIIKIINLFTTDEQELSSIDDILSQLQSEDEEIEEETAGVSEESSAVVQLVNKIILDAYARGASDIHLEPYPGKQNTQVRIRVDGACNLYQTIPFSFKNAVVSRIKIMSDLDIAERRKPQDGKINFKKYGGKDIELRVATVPTQGGSEDVVMRILAAGEPIPLNKMGFSERNYENFVSAISKPYGLIFACGPTGSGKTTTLHSALSYINKVETKIWTAEDPVEITQKGLRQVQVHPKIGFDFATAMRAFLRADPDVIMVGEMRDRETTQMGIEASLTGHLVFSTLHTNSAPESITRLLDMGMDPFNFADALLAVMAQRLVRTLCKNCKKSVHPTKSEYDELVREYGPELFKTNLNIPYTSDLTLYKPEGCDVCNNTGYRGRMGIHELLIGTDKIKEMIQTRATMAEIRDHAISEGMTTLKQDGIEKIFEGHTDLIEVRKVCIK
ncbi:MAG: GspE/PulE family protein [Desulfobacteraceae bacterium]|nr:GspE/PulE family protein [Desulfobacteraceae bacterium]MBC2757062.1 GspE/PulE family protein [Desulfobacteraceae bacterium]MBC2763721.1 GspE/PulE family protein [ANME-2 cluster archaeon]